MSTNRLHPDISRSETAEKPMPEPSHIRQKNRAGEAERNPSAENSHSQADLQGFQNLEGLSENKGTPRQNAHSQADLQGFQNLEGLSENKGTPRQNAHSQAGAWERERNGRQGNAIPEGSMTGNVGRELVLVRFIRLCSAILSAPIPQEAAALIVNRVSEIVRTDRAVLVRLTGKQAIVSVTGGGTAAQDSWFADAVETIRHQYRDRQDPVVVLGNSPEEQANSQQPTANSQQPTANTPLEKVRQAMGGTRVLWLPLWLSRDAKIPAEYALWLERWHGHSWEKTDIDLLQHAALFLGHGLVRPRSAIVQSKRRFVRLAAMLVMAVVFVFPITSSVTAPMRVVPDRPHHIFAPMDGILKDLFVQPGQWVKADELLFRYDARVLDKRLDEAYRNVAVARAKLARLEGAAHRDPQSRAELPVQQLEVERAEADAAFFAKQQARAEVRTSRAGVIVLDDPDALLGAAIQTGQMVLSVADPDQIKLRLMVPASDVGFLKEGARVTVRLDSDPLRSHDAVITRIGFDVKLSENQVPSVLAEAVWSGKIPKVRPGQRGTAKIFGETTYLGMQILRKPLIVVRTFIGI